MPDDWSRIFGGAIDKQAEAWLNQRWSTTREDARTVLSDFRSQNLQTFVETQQQNRTNPSNQFPVPVNSVFGPDTIKREFYAQDLTLGGDPASQKVDQPDVPAQAPGTAVNPYVLGTNSTTSATPKLPQDDSWTLAGGPSPAGGGPYDGVTSLSGTNTLLTRIFPDVSGTTSYVVDKGGGGTYTITLIQYYRFARTAIVNSSGGIISISAEVADGIVTNTTIA